jgi:hypothetical protein
LPLFIKGGWGDFWFFATPQRPPFPRNVAEKA